MRSIQLEHTVWTVSHNAMRLTHPFILNNVMKPEEKTSGFLTLPIDSLFDQTTWIF